MSTNLGTVYECHNKACSLGSRVDPGRFTGGISAATKNLLTGAPVESMVEGEDFGEGVCGTCGEPGTPTDEEHVSVKGNDPYDEFHKEVEARVADPDDSLTARGAQAAFKQLVNNAERDDASGAEGDNDAGN